MEVSTWITLQPQPVDPRVLKAMLPYFREKFGNTMSLHRQGREAKQALTESRETIAKLMNAKPDELFFTGSATEANNTVIKGIAYANKNKGKHIITSTIEHDCILEPTQWLEKQGYKITRLSVDKNGLINLSELEKAIQKDTILVSIMHANNEIGTLQDIEQIWKNLQRKKRLLPF